jgi:hypothetical protein
MKEVLPPSSRNKFRQNNCHDIIVALPFDLINIAKQRARQFPVRRWQDDEFDPDI